MKDAPLRECLLLCGVMLLFAVPIRFLTARENQVATPPRPAAKQADMLRADVRIWSSHEIGTLRVSSGERVLGEFGNTREVEFECELEEGGFLLVVDGKFEGSDGPCALGIEIFADQQPERTLTFWGEPVVRESVRVEWDD